MAGLVDTLTGDDLETSGRCCGEVSKILVLQGRSAEVMNRRCSGINRLAWWYKAA